MNSVWIVFWDEHISGVHKTLRSALKEVHNMPVSSHVHFTKFFFKDGEKDIRQIKITLTKEEMKLLKREEKR